MFGPRVGFIKFKARSLVDFGGEDGRLEVPGIVFMRGGAVGVLVILECAGKEYHLYDISMATEIMDWLRFTYVFESWYP
jgi:hypothetical protein